MKKIESVKEFGGWLTRYTHPSSSCNCDMTFSVYLPPKAEQKKVPAIYWLSGLTCSDDNFRTKAGAQRYASELGLALIIPDTSPRGDDIADDKDKYDLGKGAGFYVNATESPWSKHYHMYDYVTKELPRLIEENFPVIPGLCSITGHSMGGHGALICALKETGKYRSVSAFSPICNPVACQWGEGCFGTYLGQDTSTWHTYDATSLIKAGASQLPMLIDQGLDDEFLADQLKPENLESACKDMNYPVTLRRLEGYDHSYHFISTFIGEHLKFHHNALTS